MLSYVAITIVFFNCCLFFFRVNEIRAPARPCIPKLLRNKSFDATNQRFVLTFHYIMLADSSQSGKFFFPFRAWSERGHFMRMCISIYVITYYPRIRKCQLLCACLRVGCSPVSNILVFIWHLLLCTCLRVGCSLRSNIYSRRMQIGTLRV